MVAEEILAAEQLQTTSVLPSPRFLFSYPSPAADHEVGRI